MERRSVMIYSTAVDNILVWPYGEWANFYQASPYSGVERWRELEMWYGHLKSANSLEGAVQI